MKKLLIALCFLCLGFTAQAQEQTQETEAEKQARAMELMAIKIDMEIDSTIFTQATPNMYVSETPKAVIMAMVLPETYENGKAKLTSKLPATFKVTQRKEKTINGVNVMHIEGSSEAQGVTVNSTVYFLKCDAETCIMFMGMLEEGADQKYVDAINTAGISVIKN